MATVATQISNVRTRFKKDPNAETISDTTVLNFLNEAQDIIESNVILPAMQTSDTIDLLASTQEYPLSADCIKPVLVRYTANNWVLKEISFDSAKQRFDSSTGTPQQYYVWGGSVGFYPVPSANETDGVKYWYIRPLKTLVSSSAGAGEVTTSEIPVSYHWVLERGAEMLMAQMINDSERASMAEKKFYEGIQSLRERYAMHTDNLDSEIYPDDMNRNKTDYLFDPYQ